MCFSGICTSCCEFYCHAVCNNIFLVVLNHDTILEFATNTDVFI